MTYVEKFSAFLAYHDSKSGKLAGLALSIHQTDTGKTHFELSREGKGVIIARDCDRVIFGCAPSSGESSLFNSANDPVYGIPGAYDTVLTSWLDINGKETRLEINLVWDNEKGWLAKTYWDEHCIDTAEVCCSKFLRDVMLEIHRLTQDPAVPPDIQVVRLIDSTFAKEDVLTKEDLFTHSFGRDRVGVAMQVNIPAMKITRGVWGEGADSPEVEVVTRCGEKPKELIKHLNQMTLDDYRTPFRDDALAALNAKVRMVLMSGRKWYSEGDVTGSDITVPHRFKDGDAAIAWAKEHNAPVTGLLPVVGQCQECGGPIVLDDSGSYCIRCSCPEVNTNDEEIRALVCRGMIEGKIKFVGPDDADAPTWCYGVVCKIGCNAFYFGGETADGYGTGKEYLRDTSFQDNLASVCSALRAFRDDEDFRDEFCYYMAWLKGSLETDADKRIKAFVSHVRKTHEISDDHAACMTDVLRWAFCNLTSTNLRDSLIRQTLVSLCVSEDEILALLGGKENAE